MAGFDDITRKAQEFLADDKVKDALNSEQAEDISDKLLDGAEDAVNKITGNKFEGKVGDARDNADKRVGDK